MGQLGTMKFLNTTQIFPNKFILKYWGVEKPILFIEGDSSSIDYKLLQLIYNDYTTKPLGSSSKVFSTNKIIQ